MTNLQLKHAEPDRSNEWLESLAFEVALRYFTPDELQVKYDLTAEQYDRLMQLPAFQRAVDAYRREIDEEGQHFKIKARRMASEVLDTFFELANDATAAPGDRINAAKALCQYAGIDKDAGVSVNDGFQVNIQVNNGGGDGG